MTRLESYTAVSLPAQSADAESISWQSGDGDRPIGYSCDVRLKKDEQGGYTSYVPSLPGVISQGDDAEQATRNIVEALSAAIETYQAENMAIPWTQAPPKEADEIQVRVVVGA